MTKNSKSHELRIQIFELDRDYIFAALKNLILNTLIQGTILFPTYELLRGFKNGFNLAEIFSQHGEDWDGDGTSLVTFEPKLSIN